MAAFLKQQFCGGAPLQGSDTMVEGRLNSKAGAGASTTRPRRVPHVPVPPIEGGRLAVRALPALRLLLRELVTGAKVGLEEARTPPPGLAQSRCPSSAVRGRRQTRSGALAYQYSPLAVFSYFALTVAPGSFLVIGAAADSDQRSASARWRWLHDDTTRMINYLCR